MICAAPFGYSVNSDGDVVADQLYRIDLATGDAELIGPTGQEDIEGLAFNAEGVLYGVDDRFNTLLIVNTETGESVPVGGPVEVRNLQLATQAYDFGLTFDCDGALHLTSDTQQSLWSVDAATGASQPVAEQGAVGRSITALASRDDGVFGLSGMGDEALYRLNTEDASVELVGTLQSDDAPLLGFNDAGLAFDESGALWAILDRGDSPDGPLPSLIVSIDPESGTAQIVAETLVGFESLAIAPPVCEPQGTPGATVIPTLSWTGLVTLALGLPLIVLLRRRGG